MQFDNQRIDFDSPIAYYVQLKEILVAMIESGEWKVGDKLPSDSELCNAFGISRTVVRQSLQEMEYEGLIYRRKGKGSFVAKPKIIEGLAQKLTGFHQDMTARGKKPITKVLAFEKIPAGSKVAKYLGLSPDDLVYKVTRLRFIDSEPIVLVTTYLPTRICPNLEESDLTNKSLYAYLEDKCGIVLSRGQRTIEAVAANKEEANLLGVEMGSPLILLNSISYMEDWIPVEYYHALHRGDRSRFEVEVVRVKENHDLRKAIADKEVALPAQQPLLKDE